MRAVAVRPVGSTWWYRLALAALLVAPVAGAQGNDEQAKLLSLLTSPDMWLRVGAFTNLDRDSSIWTRPGMAPRLLRLLKTEDVVIARASREKHGGVSDVYNESYGEYTSDVLERCLNYCDSGAFTAYVAEAMRVPELRYSFNSLVAVTYDKPRFTSADRSTLVAAVVESIGDSTSTMIRVSALSAARAILASPHTSASDRAKVHLATQKAVNDPYPDIRLAAAMWLGELRDTADIPLLQRLARSDTSRQTVKGRTRYPVRDAAQAALSAISKPNH